MRLEAAGGEHGEAARKARTTIGTGGEGGEEDEAGGDRRRRTRPSPGGCPSRGVLVRLTKSCWSWIALDRLFRPLDEQGVAGVQSDVLEIAAELAALPVDAQDEDAEALTEFERAQRAPDQRRGRADDPLHEDGGAALEGLELKILVGGKAQAVRVLEVFEVLAVHGDEDAVALLDR